MNRHSAFCSLLLLAIGAASTALAQPCAPNINGTITVDGIVAGSSIVVPQNLPPGCTPDAGWGGIVAQEMTVFGAPDTHRAWLFLASHSGGANLDHIYIGVHVEGDTEITNQDHVTLYFDANHDGVFNAGDFALVYDVGPATPPATEECNKNPGSVLYYPFNGTNFGPPAAPPAGITNKVSWDYSTAADLETSIWELEIDLNLTSLGYVIPSIGANLFGVGAKLFMADPTAGGTLVFRFPTGVSSDANGNDVNPNSEPVTIAANLAQLSVGAACSNDVRIDSISSTDANGTPSAFSLPAAGDFDGAGNLPPAKRTKFHAQVTFFNPNNPADTSAVAVPNSGQVEFHILPWNGGFTGDFTMGTVSESFTHLKQTLMADVEWPTTLTQYQTGNAKTLLEQAHATPGGHACMKMVLNGFTVNIPNANDTMMQNLLLTTASTVKDRFLIRAPQPTAGTKDNMDGYINSGYIEYVLRARWLNVPSKDISPKPAKGRWYFQFTNAGKIGMKSLGKGYYLLRLKPGQDQYVDLAITGGKMPGTVAHYKVPATAGGRLLTPASGTPAVDIPVKEGKMITIVVNGLATVIQGQPQGGEGFSSREFAGRNFLLGSYQQQILAATAPPDTGIFLPWQHIGALIGSFDGFQTSFVAGASYTFVVPKGATTLSLAVNDIAGQYDDNQGGFDVALTSSDPVLPPTRLAGIGDAAAGQPVALRAGTNLPEFDVDVMIRNPKIRTLRPTGYVSYGIYESHPQ